MFIGSAGRESRQSSIELEKGRTHCADQGPDKEPRIPLPSVANTERLRHKENTNNPA